MLIDCIPQSDQRRSIILTILFYSFNHIDLSVLFFFQLVHSQQAGMEWHEDLQNLAIQQGIKGKKLNKVGAIWLYIPLQWLVKWLL